MLRTLAMGAVALMCAAAPALADGLPAATPRLLRYNQFWYVHHFAAFAWGMAAFAVVVYSGWGAALRTAVDARLRRPAARLAAFYVALSAGMAAWNVAPALTAYLHERAYGFATLQPAQWVVEYGQRWAIGAAITLAVVWLAHGLVVRAPRRWWLVLWALLAPLSLALTVVWPVAISPLFDRFRPMPPGETRTAVLALAARAGIPGTDVYVVDISKRTRKLNAYVTGVGPTRRIVLWDTMLEALPLRQVLAITSHEVGHYVLGHVWWSYAASMGAALAILWLLSRWLHWAIRRGSARMRVRGLDDLAAIPLALLGLNLLLFVQEPAASAFSRAQERAADRYAIRMMGEGRSLAAGFRAFVERDYADPDPPPFIVFWMGSHPPLRERVERAVR